MKPFKKYNDKQKYIGKEEHIEPHHRGAIGN
jgi:hypothetical protein